MRGPDVLNPALNQPSMLCPRAAEGSASLTIHPKQAKVEKAVALHRPENGECAAVSPGSKDFQTRAAAMPGSQLSGGKGSKHQSSRQASEQEEDPERMKHSKTRTATPVHPKSRFPLPSLRFEACATVEVCEIM